MGWDLIGSSKIKPRLRDRCGADGAWHWLKALMVSQPCVFGLKATSRVWPMAPVCPMRRVTMR
ncbi:hypothetical protein CIT25_29385 [Mesorhizobium mediterraneum]|uniref:Transposase n=1 Tax=Mesorhizobium mediterraneum TaxID=43617 RepID=A0AB36R1L7_9HYPH|nr:hypothetical protein CIT25_29385 [Mesorhizobium mediterraneum]